jgi:hypothetical protein
MIKNYLMYFKVKKYKKKKPNNILHGIEFIFFYFFYFCLSFLYSWDWILECYNGETVSTLKHKNRVQKQNVPIIMFAIWPFDPMIYDMRDQTT